MYHSGHIPKEYEDFYAITVLNERQAEAELGMLSSDESETGERSMVRELLLESSDKREMVKYENELYKDRESGHYDPETNRDYVIDEESEHRMARRLSPYDRLPLGDLSHPPIIGIEQQMHITHLHKLDPATFHPRWLAKRLNLPPEAMLAMLKAGDFNLRSLYDDTGIKKHPLLGRDIFSEDMSDEENEMNLMDQRSKAEQSHVDNDNYNLATGGGEDADEVERLMEADQVNYEPGVFDDVQLPRPIELALTADDDEFHIALDASGLIGKVSWDPSPFREVAWQEEVTSNPQMFSDWNLQAAQKIRERMQRRWISYEQRLDAIDKASFAKFGPVHYASGRNGAQRPPKLPREIISTSLMPRSRHNWVLTGIDEAKKAIYSIQVRDKDGYLRHPTYREFRNVRYRERDARLPFYLRRFQVIAKAPEVTGEYLANIFHRRAADSDQFFRRQVPNYNYIKELQEFNMEPVREVRRQQRQQRRLDIVYPSRLIKREARRLRSKRNISDDMTGDLSGMGLEDDDMVAAPGEDERDEEEEDEAMFEGL